ncbi:hypothetical protein EDD22DRAFT_414083 [Suillus occidentalis]|nr:hypothetical protein EDD22DRAFT_414083 [Suillus occidentalis]
MFGVCPAVHAVLTGPRACRRTDAGVAIRKDSLVEIRGGLERFWEDFESLRHGAGGISTLCCGLVREEDVERFASEWQAFIFECLNIIWEALRQRIVTLPSTCGIRNATYTADRLVGRLSLPTCLLTLDNSLFAPLSSTSLSTLHKAQHILNTFDDQQCTNFNYPFNDHTTQTTTSMTSVATTVPFTIMFIPSNLISSTIPQLFTQFTSSTNPHGSTTNVTTEVSTTTPVQVPSPSPISR